MIGPSKRKYLSPSGWQYLREAVENNKTKISKLTISETVAFLNSINIVCNETMLDGLMQDLHVWRKS